MTQRRAQEDEAGARERAEALRAAGDEEGRLRAALVEAARGAEASDVSALASVRAAVAAARAREATTVRGVLRALPTGWRVALALAVVVLVACAAVWLSPREDLGVVSAVGLVGTVGLLGAASLAVLRLALWPLQRAPLRRWQRWGGLWAAGLAVPLGVALVPLSGTWGAVPSSGWGGEAARCLGLGLVLALPVWGMLWLLGRGVGGSGWRSALGGLAAGLGGELALQLHCASVWPGHQVLGHVTVGLAAVMVALAVVGLRGRLQRRRAAR